jgi:MoxR-like ATPase
MDRNKTEQEKQIERNDKLQQLIEWMEGEKSKWLQSSIAYVVFDEAIFKAKELAAQAADKWAVVDKDEIYETSIEAESAIPEAFKDQFTIVKIVS